jgi:transcriptional regulator with XRE-family HTH domain
MQVSPKRHPLAVLRLILGWSQKEMADKLKVSRQTIQRVELGTLALSDKLAGVVVEETGVSYEWLMAGDPKRMPSVESDPLTEYTREQFDKHGAAHLSLGQSPEVFILNNGPDAVGKLIAILARAATQAKGKRAPLAMFKVNKALNQLAKEFCPNAGAMDLSSAVWTYVDSHAGEAIRRQLEHLDRLPRASQHAQRKRAVPVFTAQSKTNRKRR